jgi:hypothetical protein
MSQAYEITSLEIVRQDGASVPNRLYKQAGSPKALQWFSSRGCVIPVTSRFLHYSPSL